MAKWSMAILAAAAAVLSLYLTLTALAGTEPIGCGAGGLECQDLLSTRYATWLGLPVSALAAGFYATLCPVVLITTRELPPRLESVCRLLLAAMLAAAMAAAGWFLALQFVVLGKYCLYCMAIHACGLMIVGIGAVSFRFSLREVTAALAIGLLSAAVLIGGQISPLNVQVPKQRYRIALDPDLNFDAPMVIPWQREPAVERESEQVLLLNRQIRIAYGTRPVLGNEQAPHVAAKVFDYTCAYSRQMHRQLEELAQRSPQEYGIVLIHVPLSAACNPYVEEERDQHAHACELTRLALAVWLADPQAFRPFDRWLCAGEKSRTAEAAREEAVGLIGKERLESMLEQPKLEEMLRENVEFYALEEIPLLPSLLTGRRIISGSFATTSQLEEVLRGEPAD